MKKLLVALAALLALTSPGKSQQVVRQGNPPWSVTGTVNIGGTLPAFATTPSFICASGCTPSTPFADGTAFVPGTTAFNLNGGFFQTTATANALTNGQSGAFQATANRALFVNPRNAAGAETGTAAAPLRTDPTGTTTQPVSGTVALGGLLPAFAVTPTFNCGTGCGGGGGSAGIADETAFTAGTTVQQPVGGFYQSTVTANALTNGQSGASQLTINRAFHINLRNASGVELGVAAAPVRTDPTGTTVQPVSAVSLPLPGGAATSAKQAQFTAAGTPSTTDVYTVQGCPTCAAQNVAVTGTLPAYASTPAFTISGLLPAFAAPPAVTITGSLPGFATTPAVTISGTPAVTISGSLPGYASTPTFNLGSLNGAATAAKQPALGTAGAASTDVISVQGIAGGTPQPVSATSMPLPTGASTSAKQPAIGTAGAPAADVLTVQGISSGTPQPVSAASLPLPAGASTVAKQAQFTAAGAPSATDVYTVQGCPTCAAGNVALTNGIDSGTAGTPSGDVVSVQGAPGMVPLNVIAGGTTAEVCAALTTTNGTYAANTNIGGKITLASLFGAKGSGVIQSVRVDFKTAQTVEVDLYPFSGDPSSSTWTDNAANAINAADVYKVEPPIVMATAKSGLGTHTVYYATGIGQSIAMGASNTSGFFILTPTATTATLAGTTGAQVCVTVLRDDP